MKKSPFEITMDEATEIFAIAYRENFPPGGDEQDDAEATRAGLEAVLISVPMRCPNCGEWA